VAETAKRKTWEARLAIIEGVLRNPLPGEPLNATIRRSVRARPGPRRLRLPGPGFAEALAS
jgi:hypothetical protein